jgi:small subunit ribosomal protein S3e
MLVSKFVSLLPVLSKFLDISTKVNIRINTCHRIIIRATHTQNVLGEKGRRIRELTTLVQKRFKFPENAVELYAERVQNRGLCAIAQCESVKFKLLNGLAVRR